MKIDPHSADDRTPFDAPPAPEDSESQARRAAEQAALEAKMALLPDYGDEAFPRQGKSRQPKARQVLASDSPASDDADFVASPRSVVAGGCLGGVLGNMALGLALAALQRAGADLYGPGVLAIVVALVILVLVAGSWPRKVWLASGGFLLGLVLSFGAIFFLVRPIFDTATNSRTPSAPTAEPAPPDSSGGPSS